MFNVELRGINLRAGVQLQTRSVQLLSCNFLIWTGFNIATTVIINIIERAQQCTSVLDCFREENRCDYMIVHCSAGWCRLIRPKHRGWAQSHSVYLLWTLEMTKHILGNQRRYHSWLLTFFSFISTTWTEFDPHLKTLSLTSSVKRTCWMQSIFLRLEVNYVLSER